MSTRSTSNETADKFLELVGTDIPSVDHRMNIDHGAVLLMWNHWIPWGSIRISRGRAVVTILGPHLVFTEEEPCYELMFGERPMTDYDTDPSTTASKLHTWLTRVDGYQKLIDTKSYVL